MALVAMKVDVDTWRGTRDGVPRLLRLLEAAAAPATFCFSLGPDHTGRALRRALRPGFLRKVSRTSVLRHYGWRTLLYGTLLPGPDIGRREAAVLRAVAASGFETGVHAWDHVRWQDGVASASAEWTRHQLVLATQRYGEIFGAQPRLHAAAGWQMNGAAYGLERELGYALASDSRGVGPYWPCADDGRPIGPLQLPTTLPTLDELLGLEDLDETTVDRRVLELTERVQSPQVYTLHAELEGGRLAAAFGRLLRGWRTQGHRVVSLGQLASSLRTAELPRCRISTGTVPGRSGLLAVQGEALTAVGCTA